MSWIIRSSTTPMSVERNVNAPARTASMYRGSARCDRSGSKAGLNCSTWPTWSTTPRRRAAHQFIGLASGGRQRLFDQQVDAAIEQLQGNGVVPPRGRSDHGGVNLPQQFPVVGEGPRLALGGDGLAVALDGIGDADELDAFHAGELLGVKASEVSRSDDRRAKGSHAALLRSRPRPWRPSC